MRIARYLLVAVALIGLGAPSAAMAAPTPTPTLSYPPVKGTVITVTPSPVDVGATITFTGTEFGPFDSVTISFELVTAAGPHEASGIAPVRYFALPGPLVATANAVGSFTISTQVNESGTFLIRAVGAPSGDTATTALRVNPLPVVGGGGSPGAGGTPLPVTGPGTNYLMVALIGSAIAATGVVLVVLARSRRRSPEA
jgi:hypothetical protein